MNIKQLREMLCEEIQNLREKKTTPAAVNAITNASGKVISTYKMEMEYAKMCGKTPRPGFIELEDSKPDTLSESNDDVKESNHEPV